MCLLILNPGLFYIALTFLVIGVKLPCEHVCPHVGRLVGLLVGRSVGLWFVGWSVFTPYASIGAPVYSCPILDISQLHIELFHEPIYHTSHTINILTKDKHAIIY